MTNRLIRYFYEAFGLTFSSDIQLRELTPLTKNNNKIVDVVIEKADDLYPLWLENFQEDEFYIIKPNWLMLRVPEVALFCIENGNRITFSPFKEASEDEIRLYLLGTCMGAVLMQKKVLPLHGSAIAIDGKAYAILGECGAGKSTLAKAFLNRGYQLLSDDVIPVTFSTDEVPFVTPSYPHQKLWIESLNNFGLESNQFKPLVDRETKFSVPATQFLNKSLPLCGIYELKKTENEEISITAITKMERFHTLFNQTFRNFFLLESGLMEWHFETSTKLANKIPIYKIERPLSRFTANDLAEIVLSTIKNKVLTK